MGLFGYRKRREVGSEKKASASFEIQNTLIPSPQGELLCSGLLSSLPCEGLQDDPDGRVLGCGLSSSAASWELGQLLALWVD